MADRRYRAGDSIEDICRPCKLDRMHTVAADADGRPIRVSCGYCGSEHNYRGGPARPAPAQRDASAGAASTRPRSGESGRSPAAKDPFPLISDHERTAPPMTLDSPDVEL